MGVFFVFPGQDGVSSWRGWDLQDARGVEVATLYADLHGEYMANPTLLYVLIRVPPCIGSAT